MSFTFRNVPQFTERLDIGKPQDNKNCQINNPLYDDSFIISY